MSGLLEESELRNIQDKIGSLEIHFPGFTLLLHKLINLLLLIPGK